MSQVQDFLRTATNSWRTQNLALRVMRLWLGSTWIYAGWTKASDAGFLAPGSSTFIGTQLSHDAANSPIGFAINYLIEHSVQVGVFVMFCEFTVGLATIFWVAPTVIAFVGFSMSFGLWLASSFHAYPYFLASDTAYAVLWFSYFLLILGKRRGIDISFERRSVMRVAIVGTLAVTLTGLGRIFTHSSKTGSDGSSSDKKKIRKLTDFPVGSVFNFALASGAPAILFRTNTGVFAYSAICTHQGCTVGYSSQERTMVCPCHGSQFDPFNSAKVVAGPALTPLPLVKVAIEGDWVILM